MKAVKLNEQKCHTTHWTFKQSHQCKHSLLKVTLQKKLFNLSVVL